MLDFIKGFFKFFFSLALIVSVVVGVGVAVFAFIFKEEQKKLLLILNQAIINDDELKHLLGDNPASVFLGSA